MPNPQGPGLVERLAQAIYDAEDPLSGDPISVVIHNSDHLFWDDRLPGSTDLERQLEAIRIVCRAAARAMLAELPLREIAEALELAAPVFCKSICPYGGTGGEQNWPHDPLCDQVRTALAMIEEITGEDV